MDDSPIERNRATVDQAQGRGEHETRPEAQHRGPSLDDALDTLASTLLDGGEVSETAGFAVWTGMSGPLPPPGILDSYNQIIPEGADRIMAMAEKQQDAIITDRQEQRQADRRAQMFAFVSVLAILATGMTLMAIGQVLAGLLLSSPGLAAVVYAFIRSRR